MKLNKIETVTPTEYSRYIYIDRIIGRLKNEIHGICDIGCGVGNLLLSIEDHGIKAKGIDTSDESLALARAKIRSPLIDVEKCDLFSLHERYDLVFLNDVLEHIEDDAGALEYLRKNVVRAGGWLVITVPAHKRLYSAFDRNAGHHRRYDKSDISLLLNEKGFKPVQFLSYGLIFFHVVANAMLVFENRDHEVKRTQDKAEYLSMNTRMSAIRKYPGISRRAVSRVNMLHHVCFWIDYTIRHLDVGLEYCVLCRAQ